MDAPAAETGPTDFVTTWRQVVVDPAGFVASMPETGGLGDPLRFVGIVAGLDAVGTLVTAPLSPWRAVLVLAAVPIGAVLLATVLTLVTQHLFEGRAGFEPVFRAVAYGSAPAAGYWIPILGPIACGYAWYLQVRGIERVQNLDAARAVLATLVAWAGLWLVCRGLTAPPIGW